MPSVQISCTSACLPDPWRQPGLVGDPGVGAVGQRHDFAHGAGEVARFLGFANAGAGLEECVPQRRFGSAASRPSWPLMDEAGAAAGDVHDLADQVRLMLREVIEVQVDIFEARPSFEA